MEQLQPQQSATPLSALTKVIMHGDLSGLDEKSQLLYYNSMCESIGVNPLFKPFEYVKFDGKIQLYATKGCAEQLRANRGISIEIIAEELLGDIYNVRVKAITPDGRTDFSTGKVNIKGLSGALLANKMMVAETKAKRRVTFSICGLNILDETEVDDMRDVEKVKVSERVSGPPKITPMHLNQLKNLIQLTESSAERVDSWLKKAKVNSLELLTSDQAIALINKLNEEIDAELSKESINENSSN